MKTKKFLSIALAMLAVSTATMTLTACGDDDDDDDDSKTVSIYKQWEFVTSPNPADFASIVYDLSEQGNMKNLVKYTAEEAARAGLSADKHYIVQEATCTVTMNGDGKSGTIQIAGGGTLPFTDLTANTVTVNEYPCKVVAKKIVGEQLPEAK